MNLPGSDEGNWEWRYAAGRLTDEHARDLRELTERNRRTA
jgi:4-alpha-glucanotransferase